MKINVAGEAIDLLADRAVLWAAGAGQRAAGFQRTVLVADVHIGKTDTFRHFGLPVPDGDLDTDLARLTTLVRLTRADRLVILGDLVHAAAGLNDDVIQRVAAWRQQLDAVVALVPGNHDRTAMGPRGSDAPSLPPDWNIDLLPDGHQEGPFRFAHHPEPAEGCFTWCGHLHPAVVVGRGRLADRFPCFWIGAALGVLPSFGSFTGGRAVRPAPDDRLYAVTSDGLVALGARSS